VSVLVSDCGDAAVRITFQADNRDHAWRSAHELSGWLDAHRHRQHIRGTIATYDAVLVEFDPSRTDHDTIRSLIDIALDTGAEVTDRPPRHFELPVVYGGVHGPDLQRVADQQGVSADQVVAIHTAQHLTMRCYGSPGGAPMLDGPPFPHPVPRLASPRPHVPAGAVAVAGRQAVVSARPAPGGWCVIGHTPRQLIDLERTPLVPYAPGDTFGFFPISAEQWSSHEGGWHA
jgi:KipI family sensor histidine kinase inhibitor